MTLTGRLGYLSCAIVASAPMARIAISIASKRIMQSPTVKRSTLSLPGQLRP